MCFSTRLLGCIEHGILWRHVEPRSEVVKFFRKRKEPPLHSTCDAFQPLSSSFLGHTGDKTCLSPFTYNPYLLALIIGPNLSSHNHAIVAQEFWQFTLRFLLVHSLDCSQNPKFLFVGDSNVWSEFSKAIRDSQERRIPHILFPILYGGKTKRIRNPFLIFVFDRTTSLIAR